MAIATATYRFGSPRPRGAARGPTLAYFTPAALGYDNVTVPAFGALSSQTILATGFNSFTLFWTDSANVGLGVRITHLDPMSGVVVWDTGVLSGALPFLFGAFAVGASTTQRQTWSLFKLSLSNADPVLDTIVRAQMWASRR